MLLIELSISGTTHYISDEGLALTHWYNPYVITFSAPQYQMAQDYGGYVRLGFGNIALSPDTFSGDWPPPSQCSAVIKHAPPETDIAYPGTSEENAVTLFSGDLYLDSISKEEISYEIFAPKYTKKLLDEGANYNGDTVPYPKAFGTVTHVEPLRLADDGSSRPCYHLGGVSSSTVSVQIIGFNSVSAGAATQVIISAAQGWSNSTSITIYGSVNFSGTHIISSSVGSTFNIPVAFPDDNSETIPLHAAASIAASLGVFDDGVPINENVVLANGVDGAFSLSAAPVGIVTMVGTASQTSLLEVMTWGQTQLGIGNIVSTNARASSPDTAYWATSQMPLIDFLSDICAFFAHLFYISDDKLYLIDMLLDNGSNTITEFDYYSAMYNRQQAISQIKASWTSYTAESGFVNETETARYIKSIDNNWIESLYTLSSGTTSTTSISKLVDSGATFVSDNIEIEMIAQNTTDDTYATVASVSQTELVLDDDIFTIDETYVVGPSFPYGSELTIEPFHDTQAIISIALQNILNIMNKDVGEIRLPFSLNIPLPGMRYTWTDTALITDSTMYIHVRDLSYDFLNNEVIISGEGGIS